MIRRPPRSTLFPYTTLFRSAPAERILFRRKNVGFLFQQYNLLPAFTAAENVAVPLLIAGISRRSEEHTSELQSLAYLVCRLLLEKKKKTELQPTEQLPRRAV